MGRKCRVAPVRAASFSARADMRAVDLWRWRWGDGALAGGDGAVGVVEAWEAVESTEGVEDVESRSEVLVVDILGKCVGLDSRT